MGVLGGNKTADALARIEAGDGVAAIKCCLKQLTMGKHLRSRNTSNLIRTAKLLWASVGCRQTKILLIVIKIEPKILVDELTGHLSMRYNIDKLNKVESAEMQRRCRRCTKDDETMETSHLSQCPTSNCISLAN